MFKKILIANRGEITVRIAQTLQEMGIRAVAVYSDPDRKALHVSRADEAYPLHGTTSAETYLRTEKIIEIAKSCGADAIHPGYGFLSENAEFADACRDAGIIFIGPKPDVIRAMGDKVIAKKTFADAAVPTVPGWSDDTTDPDFNELKRIAADIGYPVLIKAAAGGGGKGMRVVGNEAELNSGLEAAQREAKAAFADSRVFLEKFITRPRHVEFQIFGDEHGNVVHLFERECSIQRRHQKIVEESPSPVLTPELREKMGEAAVRAAKAIGYTNAGTVEFMVDDTGAFYFLEVNTRLQVEHPVTEITTQQDLVRAQILVAAGEPLPFSQNDLRQSGHAMECRIYAEDPGRNFLPATGSVERYVPPVGPNIRVDSGVTQGSQVSVHYDPMLAKLITSGRTRQEAIAKMAWALRNYVILGLTTNIEFLHDVVIHPEHVAGNIHTQFLEEQQIQTSTETGIPDEALIAAALTARQPKSKRRKRDEVAVEDGDHVGPWQTAGAWKAF